MWKSGEKIKYKEEKRDENDRVRYNKTEIFRKSFTIGRVFSFLAVFQPTQLNSTSYIYLTHDEKKLSTFGRR